MGNLVKNIMTGCCFLIFTVFIHTVISTSSYGERPGAAFPRWFWKLPKVQKRFVSPYYLFTEAKKTATVPPVREASEIQRELVPDICQMVQEMVRVGKRSSGQHEENSARQTACLASLLGSVTMLDQLRGVCHDEDNNCDQQRAALAGEIIEAMKSCYTDKTGGVMQSNPLVYRVI